MTLIDPDRAQQFQDAFEAAVEEAKLGWFEDLLSTSYETSPESTMRYCYLRFDVAPYLRETEPAR